MRLSALIRSPSGIVIIETLLLACLMFSTFSVLVRVTDMQTVGLWVLINSLLGFSRAADFWSRGLSSFVGEARGRGEYNSAAAFVTTAVASGIVGYALLATIGAMVIWLFAAKLAGDAHAALVRQIVPLMAVTFWLMSVGGIYQGGFLAFGRPGLKVLQTVGGALIFLLLAVVMAPRFGLWGILGAQAAQAALMLVYSIVTFHWRLTRGCGSTWRRDQFRLLAAFGSKAIAVGTLQLAIEPVIRLFTSQFGGLGAVAAIELASRLIAVVRSVITGLGQILVPEFARLGVSARAELTTLYREVSRLFLLTSISAFSLLVSAAPALEELVLGKRGTGFVGFLWLLSIGWFANTVVSPAYFLLLGRRQLRPLFWSHLIMTAGAVVLGTIGGLLAGANGALAGAATAIVASSVFLLVVTRELDSGLSGAFACLKSEPSRLMPALAAVVAVTMLETSGLLHAEIMVRLASYAVAVAATLLACLVFGDVRGLAQTAARVR